MTGVQTCALPISNGQPNISPRLPVGPFRRRPGLCDGYPKLMGDGRAVDVSTRQGPAARTAAPAPARDAALPDAARAGLEPDGLAPLMGGAAGARLIASLQRSLGNASVHGLLTAQRHAEGASLSVMRAWSDARLDVGYVLSDGQLSTSTRLAGHLAQARPR